MSINVICPGCLKRFKVSDRFAGMKGPCPNCNVVISIPKSEVKIHGAEEFDAGGKTASGRLILKPISRLALDFDPKKAGMYAVGAIAVAIVAMLLGQRTLSPFALDTLGVFGLLLVSFPLVLFGYLVLRDSEELFALTGWDLNKKILMTAAIYAALWVFFECFVWYMRAGEVFILVYFAVFAVFAAMAAHAILDINFGQAVLHYLIFFVPIMLLRGWIGIGWLWIVAEQVKHGGAGPPPIL